MKDPARRRFSKFFENSTPGQLTRPRALKVIALLAHSRAATAITAKVNSWWRLVRNLAVAMIRGFALIEKNGIWQHAHSHLKLNARSNVRCGA